MADKRKWRFRIEDVNGEDLYLDDKGADTDPDMESFFEGTDAEAKIEMDRRCDLWELNTGGMTLKATYESFGVVST